MAAPKTNAAPAQATSGSLAPASRKTVPTGPNPLAGSKKTIEGYREIKFKDGGKYRGDWAEGVPHGFGTSTDPTGAEYIGVFFEGVPHGRGSHKWPNGELYEGEYQHGKQHGFGKWVHPSGDNYEGYWANDVRHGQGSYYSAGARASWFGEWKLGKQHKQMKGTIAAVRPVWATCFSHDQRLYDVAQYDKEGNYHPIAEYDEGNYLEGNYAPVPGGDLTYDYGGDEPGYRELPPQEGYDTHAPRGETMYDLAANVSQPDYDLVEQGGPAGPESSYDLSAMRTAMPSYDLVGSGKGPRAQVQDSYDVVVDKSKGKGPVAQAQDSYDVVVDKSKKK